MEFLHFLVSVVARLFGVFTFLATFSGKVSVLLLSLLKIVETLLPPPCPPTHRSHHNINLILVVNMQLLTW